jgi:hypothetical protein
MFAKSITKKKHIGWIDYSMHRGGELCCIVWKGKQAVVLLSIHAEPLPLVGERQFVWNKFEGCRKKVKTSPMHLQYTPNMSDVDTANQLHGVYLCLT